jgi:hypothetical protein
VSIADVNGNDDEPASAVPTIRISTDSSRENDKKEEENGQPEPAVHDKDDTEESESESKDTVDRKIEKGKAKEVERPVKAAGEGDQNVNEASPASVQEPFSFSNKRLCERWLDNLFMVLYEDLRVWTIFRAEVAHFRTQHVAYRKTGMEWEVLGDLGIRLHHKEEAKEAYQRCLDSSRYTVKPWAKLMEMYADEGDIQRCVQTAIRVAAYQYAEYTEMAYPTLIARSFFRLGQIHGHAKISFTLLSMGLPDSIRKIMDSYLEYGKTFKVEGSEF